MKWFKHMSNARRDAKLIQIREELGLKGYAQWWVLMECLAEEMNDSNRCEVTLSKTHLAHELETRSTRVELLLNSFKARGLLEFTSSETGITFKIEKALKIRGRSKPNDGKTRQTDLDTDLEIRSKRKERETKSSPGGLTPLALSWNEICTKLPKVAEMSPHRLRKEAMRLKEFGEEKLRAAMHKISLSRFCHGDSSRGWKATYDFLIASQENALKVLEGKYDDHTPESWEQKLIQRVRERENAGN